MSVRAFVERSEHYFTKELLVVKSKWDRNPSATFEYTNTMHQDFLGLRGAVASAKTDMASLEKKTEEASAPFEPTDISSPISVQWLSVNYSSLPSCEKMSLTDSPTLAPGQAYNFWTRTRLASTIIHIHGSPMAVGSQHRCDSCNRSRRRVNMFRVISRQLYSVRCYDDAQSVKFTDQRLPQCTIWHSPLPSLS